MKKRHFFDMDGTLFAWNNVEYFEKLYEKGYYRNLLPNINLINVVKDLIMRGEDVYVCSSYLTDSPYALIEKNESLNEYLPEIPPERRIFVRYGDDKSKYIEGGITENDYLYDDYTKNLLEWSEAGGQGIKFLNSINHTKETWQGKTITYESLNLYKEIIELTESKDVKQIPRTNEFPPFNLRCFLCGADEDINKNISNVSRKYNIEILRSIQVENKELLIEYVVMKKDKCIHAGFEMFKNPYEENIKTELELHNEIKQLLYQMQMDKASLSSSRREEYDKVKNLITHLNDEEIHHFSSKDIALLSCYDLKNVPQIYVDYERKVNKDFQIEHNNLRENQTKSIDDVNEKNNKDMEEEIEIM